MAWKIDRDGQLVREYVAYSYQYVEDRTIKFNAYPTFGDWATTRDLLPPSTIAYTLIDAPSKPDAISQFKRFAS